MRRGGWTWLFALATAILVANAAGAQAERPRYDVRVFARIGDPGQPEPIAIGAEGNVYVGTNQQDQGGENAPSRVFVFSPAGADNTVLLRARSHLSRDRT